ncbi:hypothetical protein [Leuconostoc citreum]|uniref:Oligosaccharide repeat unit polymerase Wzy n=1 Tax=Leuconostoc citreum (strain KM20) TaxID=349519 RepID=B1MZS5_LEUCK|nr:hypothetical protein [Leuconostoc citreum]ACA83027.1 Oligosaccharide repeat unit polymerase Wzy [Leuconostoc citreum KM20]
MKSKNLKRIAINFLVTLIFIYSYGGLFLIPNSSLTRGIIFSPGPLVVLILLLFIFSQTLNTRKESLNKPRINFFLPILLFCLLNLLSFVYLLFYKNVNDRTILTGVETALASLIYIPLAQLVGNTDDVEMDKIFNIVSFIAIVSISIQIVYANYSNIMLLKSFDLSKLSNRNGGYRVQFFDPLVSIYILNSFNKLLRSLKLRYITPIFIGLCYLLFISQTRSILIFVLIALAVDYVLNLGAEISKGKISVFSLVSVIPIIGGLMYFLKMVVFQLYKPIQDGTYLNDGSYFARIGEITYYVTEIKKNIFFGLGNFAVESSDSVWWSIVHGPTGYYYTQDIGLLGDIARLGICVIPIYLVILYVMYRQQKRRLHGAYYGYIIIMLGAIGNYSLLNNGFALGLILYFNEYYSRKGKNVNE